MVTFVDSSALYALVDGDDEYHSVAEGWLSEHLSEPLVTHNYVVVESASLIHNRLGGEPVRRLMDELLPGVVVQFVGEVLHGRAVAAHLVGIRRRISLVDRVSFEFLREARIDRAFAFDRDFAREGFTVVPS